MSESETIVIKRPITYRCDYEDMKITIDWPEPHKLKYVGSTGLMKIFKKDGWNYMLLKLKDGEMIYGT